jgi:hypothetical protein
VYRFYIFDDIFSAFHQYYFHTSMSRLSYEKTLSTQYPLAKFIFLIFLSVWEFELRASHLLSGISLEPHFQPFCYNYFKDKVLLFAQAGLSRDPLILHILTTVAGMTDTSHCALLLV